LFAFLSLEIDWAAVGAFFSGIASILTAITYVRWQQKRSESDCEKRLEAFKAGLHEMEEHHENS